MTLKTRIIAVILVIAAALALSVLVASKMSDPQESAPIDARADQNASVETPPSAMGARGFETVFNGVYYCYQGTIDSKVGLNTVVFKNCGDAKIHIRIKDINQEFTLKKHSTRRVMVANPNGSIDWFVSAAQRQITDDAGLTVSVG